MGTTRRPSKVKLVTGLICHNSKVFNKAKLSLEKIFGDIDFESEPIDFIYTDYYEKEMGKGLKRIFLSFEKPLNLDGIYKVKLKTNRLEKALSLSGRRLVNIDPGYLDMAKFVLFSTKDYSHRVYLAGGIFAETTYHFKDGRYVHWPWTYPDYRTNEYHDIFTKIRTIYKEKAQTKQ